MTSTSVPGQNTHKALMTSRRRSALALMAGALIMLTLIQTQTVRFYYTPLIVGLTYLGAALAGRRRGTLWAPGIVTACWGIAVLLGVHGVVTIDGNLSYEIAGGIGVVIVLLLRRYTLTETAGWVGLAVSYGIILLHNYAHPPAWVFHGVTFAVLLGLWSVWELRPDSRDQVEADSRQDEVVTRDVRV